MDFTEKILANWGFHKTEVTHKYEVKGDRIVYWINTDRGDFILKGIPVSVDKSIIIGNVKAHEYLGNQHSLAPKLFYLSDGNAYLKDSQHYFYVLEFIEGRQMQETYEDEFLLGQAAARMHRLSDYDYHCAIDCEMMKKVYREWFPERSFKQEYDAIIDSLPDFGEYGQCFIHTDIGPHNAILNHEGKVMFIDLDDSGIGPKYIDLGWPFIMQYVKFNQQTKEMHYRFDLAKAFLKGYYGDIAITRDELNKIWNGAIYMHISYMQCYGPDAVASLWQILKFGMAQKEKLFELLQGGE
jgi:Ser/Thr protein kinase RdoA (MazF antagonist)